MQDRWLLEAQTIAEVPLCRELLPDARINRLLEIVHSLSDLQCAICGAKGHKEEMCFFDGQTRRLCNGNH